jgi:hypothetical protein
MKKYAFYIAIVAILLTIALVLIFNDKPGSITGSEKNFAISDTASVTKIKYVFNGDVLELTRQKNMWVVNGKYPAKVQLVNVTLKFLQQFNVISAVPKESVRTAVDALNEKSLQVTIEGDGEPMVQYSFCEIDSAPSKAYIMMQGSTKPYIANITGFDLPLFTIFSLSERMWRDSKIFTTPVDNIMMVGLAYPQKRENTFSISVINDTVQLNQGEDATRKNISKEAVDNYFTNVTSLKYDALGADRLGVFYKDIKNNIPYVELVVKSKSNKLETLKLYQVSDNNSPSKVNPDLLVGLVGNDTVPVQIKYTDVDPLLKVKGDFVGK